MIEFKKYKLGDIADIIVSTVDKKSKPGQKTVRLCNFVDVYKNWAITHDLYDDFMVATASDVEIERFKIKKGQVAFTKDSETRDDIGIATYIAEDFDDVILGYHTALVTPNEKVILGKYLNAFMHSKYILKYFEMNATGSGMRYTLSLETLHDIPVLVPSLEDQKRIGDFFSTIDRKICINRKANAELEALAKQIYDYWFVQFDFPDANGRPYKSSGGKMVYDSTIKRDIPEEWEVAHLFEAANVLYGFPFSTEQFVEDETPIPVVRIRDIPEGTHSAYSTQGVDDKYKLERGDVVIGMDGNFHMNIWHESESYLNQRCVRIRTNDDEQALSSISLYYAMAPYIQSRQATIQGSTVGHLSDKDMKQIYVLRPSTNESFNPKRIFDTIEEQIISGKNEINRLTDLREFLIPLLLNGQVSIS